MISESMNRGPPGANFYLTAVRETGRWCRSEWEENEQERSNDSPHVRLITTYSGKCEKEVRRDDGVEHDRTLPSWSSWLKKDKDETGEPGLTQSCFQCPDACSLVQTYNRPL